MKKLLLALFLLLSAFSYSQKMLPEESSYRKDTSNQNISKENISNKENILDFEVFLTVNQDASVSVTEDITINALHNQIKRGVYRDIPTKYSNKISNINLSMDGRKHPFFTNKQKNNIRINFGDNDYISKGVHTYSLSYTMGHVIQSFKDYDELYWNVTGNFWAFPIQRASIKVSLPQNAKIYEDRISSYSGSEGSKSSNIARKGLYFEIMSPLSSYSGMTITIPFQKGIVKIKSPFLPQGISDYWAIIFVIIAFAYFILTWLAVGKDPQTPYTTEFAPPKDVSPAFMRYFLRRWWDDQILSTIFISLAMKGYIIIEDKKPISTFSKLISGKSTYPSIQVLNNDMTTNAAFSEKQKLLQKLSQITTDEDKQTSNGYEKILRHAQVQQLFAQDAPLPEEEETVLQILKGSFIFEISQENKRIIGEMVSKSKKILKEQAKPFIKRNYVYLIFPSILLVILAVILAFMYGDTSILLLMIVYFIFMLICVALPLQKRIISLILANFLFIPLLLNGSTLTIWLVATLIIFWGLVIYINLITNITEEGKNLYFQILGFKRYMDTAENARVAASIPTQSEEIFCNYLPYAYALDIQSKWIKEFRGHINDATMEEKINCLGGYSLLSGSALTSAINSATNRGRHSGSGGHGFSGGGFGGGGGGGR